MKKLKVEQDLCIACGACMSIDEEDFKFDENGLSIEKKQIIDDDNEKAIIAMESCPTGAIKIEDTEETSAN